MHAIPWRGDDHQLLAALGRGDVHAAAALFDRFGPDVNRLVRRVMGPDREHDDLVQQVFVNALGSASGLRDAAALRSWMTSVALNTVRQELRRRTLHRRFFGTIHSADDAMTAVDDHVGRDTLHRVYRVLDRLGAEDRIVFVLKYLADQTHDEISEATGWSVPTVKRRLQRARKRFEQLARRDRVLAERLEASVRFGGGL